MDIILDNVFSILFRYTDPYEGFVMKKSFGFIKQVRDHR